MEAALEDSLREQGVNRPVVQCPTDASYDEGDMVICDATSASDGTFEIVLNMRNDGYYEWQAQ